MWRTEDGASEVVAAPVLMVSVAVAFPLASKVTESGFSEQAGADCAMDEKSTQKIRIQQHTFMGSLWIAAWLFTIGFLHLTFWKGVLAIVLWPYYLGVACRALVH
ncbi:MAG TPA: hypothetical protein VEV41_19360 [Terriglobales bacterium]|nr:hypothetical protein [Terriglobales bacterium]